MNGKEPFYHRLRLDLVREYKTGKSVVWMIYDQGIHDFVNIRNTTFEHLIDREEVILACKIYKMFYVDCGTMRESRLKLEVWVRFLRFM